MIKAVLLDLDNTLQNRDETFARAYWRLMREYLIGRWKQDNLSDNFWWAIRAFTSSKRDRQQTNVERLLGVLCQKTGIPIADLRTALEAFHRDVYPRLQTYTTPIEMAAPLVNFLRERQYAVAIVITPLYPAEAVRQRLDWAGLSDNFDDYALVTNADIMRYTKADPEFYVEAVARIGVEPDEAVMVGGSLKYDILPARQVGLHTYHVLPEVSANSDTPADAAGTLDDFFSAVREQSWFDMLLPRPLSPEIIEPEMRGNLAALFGTLDDAQPHFWQQHPDPNEWSPVQIICHLLENESSVHRARLQRILAEDNPFLVDSSPLSGVREAADCDDDGFSAARRFAAERQQTLDWLRQLQPSDWLRPARHSIFGLTTLLEMAHFTAQHDRLHINQLCQTLGRCE